MQMLCTCYIKYYICAQDRKGQEKYIIWSLLVTNKVVCKHLKITPIGSPNLENVLKIVGLIYLNIKSGTNPSFMK